MKFVNFTWYEKWEKVIGEYEEHNPTLAYKLVQAIRKYGLYEETTDLGDWQANLILETITDEIAKDKAMRDGKIGEKLREIRGRI